MFRRRRRRRVLSAREVRQRRCDHSPQVCVRYLRYRPQLSRLPRSRYSSFGRTFFFLFPTTPLLTTQSTLVSHAQFVRRHRRTGNGPFISRSLIVFLFFFCFPSLVHFPFRQRVAVGARPTPNGRHRRSARTERYDILFY